MSAIAWTTIRDAVQTWIRTATGLAGDHVIWSGQSSKRLTGPFIELKLRLLVHRGLDWMVEEHDGGTPGVLTEKLRGPRSLSLSITAWQGAPAASAGSSVPANTSPLAYIDDAITGARLRSVHEALVAAGVGVGTADIIDVQGETINDVQFEARAIANVKLHVVSEFSTVFPTGEGWIEIVNGSGLPGDLQSIVWTADA